MDGRVHGCCCRCMGRVAFVCACLFSESNPIEICPRGQTQRRNGNSSNGIGNDNHPSTTTHDKEMITPHTVRSRWGHISDAAQSTVRVLVAQARLSRLSPSLRLWWPASLPVCLSACLRDRTQHARAHPPCGNGLSKLQQVDCLRSSRQHSQCLARWLRLAALPSLRLCPATHRRDRSTERHTA